MYYIAHFDVYKIMPVYKKMKYDFYLVLDVGISAKFQWLRYCDSLYEDSLSWSGVIPHCFSATFLLFNKLRISL